MTQGKPTTTFEPHIDPTLSPAAQKYAREAAGRKQNALPKYTEEVAGGATPPIPRFDMPYEGPPATPAQVAEYQRRESIINQQQAPGPQMPVQAILPHDILPPEAQEDPHFIPGQGSMYASAQPSLAFRYGVIRNGQRLAPQQLQQAAHGAQPRMAPQGQQGGPGMRRPAADMAADLAKIAELEKAHNKAEESPLIQASADSVAGQAAGVGGGPRDGSIPEKAMTQEEMRRKLNDMDEFDLNSIHEMMTRDLFNNEEQRKLIESRLEPLDLGTLIMDGCVSQRVPIVPPTAGSPGFVPEFESLGGDVDLALKRLIVEESKSLKVDDRYLLDKYSIMGIAASLKSVNGKPFPPYKNGQGDFDDELFWKRFNKIVRLPIPMLASIGVNYFWFDIRVRKLFVAKNVKNG